MQGIKELMLLLQQHALPSQLPNFQIFKPSPDVSGYYNGILQGNFASDSDAVVQLFPGASATHPPFLKCKSGLRKEIVGWIKQFNTALLRQNDSAVVFRECHKQWLVVRTFSGQNAQELMLPLVQQLLEIAEKFEFTSLCIDMYAFLRVQYCLGTQQNPSLCDLYNRRYQSFQQIYDAERRAEEQYVKLNTLAADHRIPRSKIRRMAAKAAEDVNSGLKKYKTAKLILYGHLLRQLEHICADDFKAVKTDCARAMRALKTKPFSTRETTLVFYYMQLVATIRLRQYAGGVSILHSGMTLAGDSGFNWFKFRELGLFLLLHTGRYEQAAAWLSETTSHPQMAEMPDYMQKCWWLYRSYLDLWSKSGPLSGSKVRPGNLKSEGGTIGFQAAQLVLDCFQQILSGKKPDASLLLDFANRHLNHATTGRSYNFLLLMHATASGNLEKSELRSTTKKYLAKLHKLPVQLAHQSAEMEIIPYDALWVFVEKFLNDRSK